jgi:hypothetical protein
MGDRPRSGGSSTSGGPAAPPTESYGDEEPF